MFVVGSNPSPTPSRGYIMDDKDEKIKEMEALHSKMEGATGIRVLIAYQCIYCGAIVDEIEQCSQHGLQCPERKIEDDTK